MNFKTIKLSTGRFAVQKGRVKKNGSRTYIKSTVSDTLEEAEQFAAYYTAIAAVEKAHDLIKGVTLRHAKEIAHEANYLIDSVVNRDEAENPDFCAMDARGFLA